jgi:hypothetical protein
MQKEKRIKYTREQKLILDQFTKILKRIGVIENTTQVEMMNQYEEINGKWVKVVECKDLLFSIIVDHSIDTDHLTIIKEICGYDITDIIPMGTGAMKMYFSPLQIIDEYRANWIREYKDRFFSNENTGNPRPYEDKVGYMTGISLDKYTRDRLRSIAKKRHIVDGPYDYLLLAMMDAYEDLPFYMKICKDLEKRLDTYEGKKEVLNQRNRKEKNKLSIATITVKKRDKRK